MAKYNGYGKRFSGSNAVEYKGAQGLRLNYGARPEESDWMAKKRHFDSLRQFAAPSFKQKSQAQLDFAIKRLEMELVGMLKKSPEDRQRYVDATFVSIAEINTALERLHKINRAIAAKATARSENKE